VEGLEGGEERGCSCGERERIRWERDGVKVREMAEKM
jgi:hypothetical protein